MNFLEKTFKLSENNTNVKTEIIAGVTTFLTMAYILAVNPNILGTVMDNGAVFTATAIASAFATFLMAFLANYPIALSAGMGLNAYFAYSVCLNDLASEGANAFTIALTAVLIEGIIFIILSLFKFREALVNCIPQNLKYGISAGIGLYIALIGLKSAGVVVSDQSTLITLGNFGSPQVYLCLFGVLIIVILSHYKIMGAILWGILIIWGLGIIAQLTGIYTVDATVGNANLIPNFSVSSFIPPSIEPTFFKFNFAWGGKNITPFIVMVFSFLFVDLFNTVGTVVGVADKANLLNKNGELPRVGRVFMSDAVGTVAGSCLGTSTVSCYIESAAGVAVGGKTGLTALTTGCLFILALFLSPIFLAVPGFATAAALIYVGMLMMSSVTKMKFSGDYADSIGGYFALIMMPLTYSIANGIMFGICSWVIVKAFTGKFKDVPIVMWVVFAMFAIRIATLIIN